MILMDNGGPTQVVFVATEVAPWSKTGGLGDVVSALPIALARRCVAARGYLLPRGYVLLPLHLYPLILMPPSTIPLLYTCNTDSCPRCSSTPHAFTRTHVRPRAPLIHTTCGYASITCGHASIACVTK